MWNADWDGVWIVGFPLFYMAEFISTLVSTELSGGPPSTWMGVALASDDYGD